MIAESWSTERDGATLVFKIRKGAKFPSGRPVTAHAAIFFFQAEDGIRGGHVPGVQTCALPIWPRGSLLTTEGRADGRVAVYLDACPGRSGGMPGARRQGCRTALANLSAVARRPGLVTGRRQQPPCPPVGMPSCS